MSPGRRRPFLSYGSRESSTGWRPGASGRYTSARSVTPSRVFIATSLSMITTRFLRPGGLRAPPIPPLSPRGATAKPWCPSTSRRDMGLRALAVPPSGGSATNIPDVSATLRSVSGRGMVSGVSFLLRWTLLPLSVVVGLAALLRMAGPSVGHRDLTGIIRLPRPVTGAILTLFGLAAVVFFAGLARRLRGRRRGEGEDELTPERPPMPAWMRAVTQILSLANFVLLAYLIWRGVIPLTDLLSFGQGMVGG